STSLPAFVKRFMYETKASAASPSHLSCTVLTACCTALPRLPASVAASRNRAAASEATLLLMLPTCLYNAERFSPPEPRIPCRSATALAPAPSLTENLPTGSSRQPYCSPMSSAVNALTFSASDRKSTRLNSSHVSISYAVFCLKHENNATAHTYTRV